MLDKAQLNLVRICDKNTQFSLTELLKYYKEVRCSQAALKWLTGSRYLGSASYKNTTYTIMHKFAIAVLGFLSGFFLCEFIISFFLSDDKELHLE